MMEEGETDLHLQRSSCSDHRIPDSESGRLLVALDGGRVTDEFDDFTHELVVTDSDQFIHPGSRHLVSDDH